MTVHLDHLMVLSRTKVASAKRLAEVLMIHYCFRVDPEEFDAILRRIKAAGIPHRSNVHGPVDYRIDTQHGGSIVYWNEPDGHQWEMLTVSYARRA